MIGKTKYYFRLFLLILFCFAGIQSLQASKLVEMKVLDRDHLILHFKDGDVLFADDGRGQHAYAGHESNPENSYAVYYGDALDLSRVSEVGSWIIRSNDDDNFGSGGVHPDAVFRKTRVNGMSYTGWDHIKSDHGFDYTREHFIYLKLPFSMEQGRTYRMEIDEAVQSDTSSQSITFDIFSNVSEAVHVNLAGYMSSSRIKAADLYHFMGDGGNRDYSGFSGNEVFVYNVDTEEIASAGRVSFWMSGKAETHWNLTGSDVWTVDFTGFSRPGTYRLAVEGIGCSQDFEIRDDIYHIPYKVSIMGYYYMRIGEDRMDMVPVPRRPLWIQDADPPNCKIYITDMNPYHPEWTTFSRGDVWDRPADWARFRKEGYPTNANAIGGHSDALDWDRHLGHVVNIYDLCLAYLLSGGALDDDDLGIGESGNSIPDILDEARNEVDFWLNLRYQGGYSHGITNPDGNNRLFQADNTPIAAWANALNSSMLAYCFQIAGLAELRSAYLDSAIIAYRYADNLPDPMLNTLNEGIRGRDFKMMSAAYLYNLTGDTDYEDVLRNESVVTGPHSSIHQQGSYNQLWGTAAYLLTQRPVNYPELRENMRLAIIDKAKSKEAGKVNERPSRRGYAVEQAWWQTNQDMHRTILAHAVTTNQAERLTFLDALVLEADWGLGRNPLNKIQMTTAATELADKRSIENCYTTGRNDGTPGLHPGHTPYFNTESWGGNMAGSNPGLIFSRFYPGINSWPHAEKYINTRFIWAHSEFTPRQTMRGKALLYAYLYSLSKSGGAITPAVIADAGGEQRVIDADGDGKAAVHLDGSRSYSASSEIVSYRWIMNDIEIATGMTAEVELALGTYEIMLEVENAEGESASDRITIEIAARSYGEADYDFETPDQLDDWTWENWGEGGAPSADISSEESRGGSKSLKLSGNFITNSQIALKKNGNLPEDIEMIVYYVWLPQELIDASREAAEADSSTAGGIQNYFLYTGWNWRDRWVDLHELQGDAWNEISFQIPEDVNNSDIIQTGLVFTLQNADIGQAGVYIDDITYQSAADPADYDFETPGQFDDWFVENWGDGGTPSASLASEKALSGSYSVKIAGDFIPGSENAFRRNGTLESDVSALIYHVWIPQAFKDSALAVFQTDSAQTGGIQNYLMFSGWQWRSRWFSFHDLQGDGWNRVEFAIPEEVARSAVQSIGVSFKTLGVNGGQMSVYIDDIIFSRSGQSTFVDDGDLTFLKIPDDYQLFNNYPNPFNAQTIISYSLPEESDVKIAIFSITGQRIIVLVNEKKNAGYHQAAFDAGSLASGVYFYRLEAGRFSDVKKMLLLR